MRSKIAQFQRRSAPETEEKDEAWFYGQLTQHTTEVVPKGRDFLIVCPFHADNNPSCGVDRITGVFKCWSCNAGGGWNKLAKAIGAETLSVRHGGKASSGKRDLKSDMSRALGRAGVKDGTRRQKKKEDVSRPMVEPWPVNKPWRSVPGTVLREIGCVKVIDLKFNVIRVGLPVRNIHGELQGYTCRSVEPENVEPKYVPLAATHDGYRDKELPTGEALFLAEKIFEEDWDTVVLVEGPYDALHLFANGIPAVSILGTGNWTPEKSAVVKGIGVQLVVVLMDNDDAGHQAQEKIIQDLKKSIRTKGLKLPKNVKDPGKLSKKSIKKLGTVIESM